MMSWLRDEWDRVRGRARYDFELDVALHVDPTMADAEAAVGASSDTMTAA